MKKLIAVLLTTVVVAGLMGCGVSMEKDVAQTETTMEEGQSGEKKMVMILPMATLDYFNYMAAQLECEAEKAGVDLTFWNVNSDFSKIGEYVEMACEQDYDVAFVIDPTGSAQAAIKESSEKGLLIVGYDANIYPELENAWVTTGNEAMGRMIAEYALDMMKDEGKDSYNLVISYNPSVQSEIDRYNGVMAAIEESDLNIDVELATNTGVDLEDKINLWDDMLIRKAAGEIDYVIAVNSTNALGCLASAESAGRMELKVFGIDDEADQLNALQKDGIYYATIAQDSFTFGKKMMEAALKLTEDGGGQLGTISVDGILVTRDNVKEYLEKRQENVDSLSEYISSITSLN